MQLELDLKMRSETLDKILSDPSIELADNGDNQEIIELELESIIFQIENSNSRVEQGRLYQALHARLRMVQ